MISTRNEQISYGSYGASGEVDLIHIQSNFQTASSSEVQLNKRIIYNHI
jgi:hypothetical protein